MVPAVWRWPGVPGGATLRVDRAYFTWKNIAAVPLYLSLGRRPSTDGPPMHFRNDRCPEFPVAGVEEFLALMSNVRREDGSEVELSKDSLPQEMEVVVLKPAL